MFRFGPIAGLLLAVFKIFPVAGIDLPLSPRFSILAGAQMRLNATLAQHRAGKKA
jgi:hypothetical protein